VLFDEYIAVKGTYEESMFQVIKETVKIFKECINKDIRSTCNQTQYVKDVEFLLSQFPTEPQGWSEIERDLEKEICKLIYLLIDEDSLKLHTDLQNAKEILLDFFRSKFNKGMVGVSGIKILEYARSICQEGKINPCVDCWLNSIEHFSQKPVKRVE
jgi:hypothetical protein